MLVRTTQGYDLRTFRGPIDLNRGTYKDMPNVSCAQRKLYNLINEDQLVWCGRGESYLIDEVGRYLHEIDVDSRDIVAVIDSLVWCHIIGYGDRYIPPDEHVNLRAQARTKGGHDYEAVLRKAEDAYLAANLPPDLWSGVRKVQVTKESDELLVKFPFVFSTIRTVDIVTREMAEGRRSGTPPVPRRRIR